MQRKRNSAFRYKRLTNMKKVFTLVCAAILSLGIMHAEVLLNEHFNQTTETLASNDNAFGDEISATGWTNISGGGDFYINATDLTYSGYKSASDDTKSAEFKTNKVKKVATPLKKTVSSGSVFMAAIVDLQAYSTTSATASTRDYLWALVNGTSSVSTAGNHYCRLQLQKIEDGKFQFGIAKSTESAAYISYTETLSLGKFLLVTEYEFVSGDQNDVVRLYVNPVKSDSKPAATIECKQYAENTSGTNVGSGTKADAAQLKSILLNASSTLKAGGLIDEIKVVTSWADLWEADGGEEQNPAIEAESSLAFGTVTINEAAEKKIAISGSNLKGAISVESNSSALVPAVASISKAEAEAGYELSLTLTAAEAGEGSAKLTLKSEDATDKVIEVSWTAAAPVQKLTIAQAKLKAEESEVYLNDVVVIRVFGDETTFITVQDATGALNLADYFETCTTWKAGDKISGLGGVVLGSSDYVEGFFSIFPTIGSVASSDNAFEPFAVSLAEFTKYGPAYVKVEDVTFPLDVETFAAGGITISQDAASANLQIPAGCDIIGESVPASADVAGYVCHPYLSYNILLEKSADVTDRVARTATGVANTAVQGKVVKIVRNGQVVILRDGKEFNLLGTEL